MALLGFEVAAIVALHSIGSVQSMQVPWGEDLTTWLSTGTVEELAAPIVRLFALVIAYWMFVSTALTIVAQLTRVPVAVRATSMFTLPAIRRAVEGAMAVSIATSSFVGMTGTAYANSATDIAESVSVGDDNLSVPTPRPTGIPADSSSNVSVGVTINAATAAEEQYSAQAASPSDQFAAEAEDITTTASVSGGDSVPTPRVGVLANNGLPEETTTTSTTTTSTTTTTIIPRSTPSTPTAETQTPAPQTQSETQVLGVQQYQVKAGDNLWTISRDALASATNRAPGDLTNQEIWEYWTAVKEANVNNLRSGDPHWIFPDEVITLPAHTVTAK